MEPPFRWSLLAPDRYVNSICVMTPPIHLGAWSVALMLWLPFELFCVLAKCSVII